MSLKTSTYSMWNSFRNCRKLCFWRYDQGLKPVHDYTEALDFGSLIHACLEAWHSGGGDALDAVLAKSAATCQGQDLWERHARACAMMAGYTGNYPTETWEPVEFEKKFCLPLETTGGQKSRTFQLEGKVDGIVRLDGALHVLEHKTTSQLDASYLEKLWLDLQITLYCAAMERIMGEPVAGVVYNVLCKSKIRQKKEETPEEFALRLMAEHRKEGMYHREVLVLPRQQIEQVWEELWELSKAYLDARRRGSWYMNTSYCYQWGRPCPYVPLCRSGGSQLVIDSQYTKVAPHEELRTEEQPTF